MILMGSLGWKNLFMRWHIKFGLVAVAYPSPITRLIVRIRYDADFVTNMDTLGRIASIKEGNKIKSG